MMDFIFLIVVKRPYGTITWPFEIRRDYVAVSQEAAEKTMRYWVEKDGYQIQNYKCVQDGKDTAWYIS